MLLSRHTTPEGPRWARDGRLLPRGFSLASLLGLPSPSAVEMLRGLPVGEDAPEEVLAPLEAGQEVWASGVTYLRSRDARKAESAASDVYDRVYEAERPEIFFKAQGWRVAGGGAPVAIRADSGWDVPEPELVIVVDSQGAILGYTAGNDMSSRAIEGENPLYLPQAKVYDGSCSLGPGIVVADASEMEDLAITLTITRGETVAFSGKTSTSRMKRRLPELVEFLHRSLSFPEGVFLMTGTGIVPPEDFTLEVGDRVEVGVGKLRLRNPVREAR